MPMGKKVTMASYPRILLPDLVPPPPSEHFIRLVENEELDKFGITCYCGFHGGCTLNRKLSKRPLGLAWAFMQDGHKYGTKQLHKKAAQNMPKRRREDARNDLVCYCAEDDSAYALVSAEIPSWLDEPDKCP